jgi:hypothetical protein
LYLLRVFGAGKKIPDSAISQSQGRGGAVTTYS